MDSVVLELQSSLSGVRDIVADMDRTLPLALGDAKLRARQEVVRSLCPVVISGYFESFLKDLARVTLADVNARSVSYASLPQRMKKTHYESGAAALQQKSSRPKRVAWIAATVDDLARRLGSTGQPDYELAWEAFADTQANPGPDVVRDFLERYGCKDVAQSLARASGVAWPAMELALSDLLVKRNECAHTGRVQVVPTTSEVAGHCDTVEMFAKSIVEVLRAHLAGAPFGVHVNTASEDELARVPGVGAARARAITAFRTANGHFGSVNDIRDVPGIGPQVLDALRRHAHV